MFGNPEKMISLGGFEPQPFLLQIYIINHSAIPAF